MKAAEELKRLEDKIRTGALPPDEPLFVLRARDTAAEFAVRHWANSAKELGAPEAKWREAVSLADQMRDWPVKQVPGHRRYRVDLGYRDDNGVYRQIIDITVTRASISEAITATLAAYWDGSVYAAYSPVIRAEEASPQGD